MTTETSKGTILAIDDEPTSLKILTEVLEAEGYSVQSASSGEMAMKSIHATPPELILLDVVMPGIDGFEICRRLRMHEATRQIPVILLSANTDAKERVDGFKLGAVDFVSKPFQREELIARVHTHLSFARLQAELKQQTTDLQLTNKLLQSEIAVREEMATSLVESEEKFRTLAGSAQDAFVMLDDEDRIVFWNRAAAGMFGYTEKEIFKQKFHEHLVPERLRANYTKGVAQHFTADVGMKIGQTGEMITLRRDGTEFPAELSVATVKLHEKWFLIAVIRDVTGRHRAQETLQRSEERLNLALDAAHLGTWDIDLINGSVWRSRIHDQIFGYDSHETEWNHDKFLERVVPEDRHKLLEEIALLKKTGLINSECRIIRDNDHEQRWISVQGKIYNDKQGKPARIMGMVYDITESKLAEQERQASEAQSSLSQKLESVGRLASGVAHEINTPMQFITDNTQFLKRAITSLTDVLVAYQKVTKTIASGNNPAEALALALAVEENAELNYLLEEIPRTFDETMSGLQRVTHIIKSLKEFSHPNTNSKQPADLNKSITTTIAVSRHEWKYVAEVVPELDPDLPLIPLRIDEMNQVMLNLIVNAAHAIGDALKLRGEAKGVITIRTKHEKSTVLVEVEDNGTGIPASAQAHIFEPFFTTKGVGKGTGQGLAIVRNIIVKNHGGEIFFTTTAGKGTVFHIRLPISVPEEIEASDPADD